MSVTGPMVSAGTVEFDLFSEVFFNDPVNTYRRLRDEGAWNAVPMPAEGRGSETSDHVDWPVLLRTCGPAGVRFRLHPGVKLHLKFGGVDRDCACHADANRVIHGIFRLGRQVEDPSTRTRNGVHRRVQPRWRRGRRDDQLDSLRRSPAMMLPTLERGPEP
jgi:hypothetical protein